MTQVNDVEYNLRGEAKFSFDATAEMDDVPNAPYPRTIDLGEISLMIDDEEVARFPASALLPEVRVTLEDHITLELCEKWRRDNAEPDWDARNKEDW